MILNRLSIVNFKNIAQAELHLSAGINCFLGNNGMGKTNLLDAVYYLSFCKSNTNVIDSQNIRHNEDFFMLQGNYDRDNVPEEIYCGQKRKQKKQFKRNKKEYERLSDHIGFIPLVMVSPADSELIRGGSEERRKFLDLVISQFNKEYLNLLIRYNKALAQRNALLKQEITENSLYEIWEEQMMQYGSSIYRCRKAFLEQFIPVFQEFYSYISSDNESVELRYNSDIERGNLMDQLSSVRNRDLILGYSTRGVHRDDLEMSLGEYPMKRIGSQGQNKTFLVALKLAQFDFLSRNGTTTPILLLDDIFDKLDSKRVERIIQLVSGERFGQIFITDTNRKYLDEIIRHTGNDYHLFSVCEGEITKLEEV
ncbi:DNA replication/repair protein RecF [Coprobacter tertius]|uniref:DNA replication and repair protein RecF n=1 Tax=Coprobacter tertius TaxID=2944915 RepID=A0ABT1MDP0_9BACT|nr:DNA replication and repair protein RecF [Coprobacter tertius]MCP9610758.1 DNA replication and repair protein RecF [Coprobacter tertius]